MSSLAYKSFKLSLPYHGKKNECALSNQVSQMGKFLFLNKIELKRTPFLKQVLFPVKRKHLTHAAFTNINDFQNKCMLSIDKEYTRMCER